MTMVLVICLSFSGYLISDIPVYFAWLGKVSYFSYAYAAVVRSSPLAAMRCVTLTWSVQLQVRNELLGSTFKDKAGRHVAGSAVIPYGLQNDYTVSLNVIILLIFTVASRVFAFFLTDAALRLHLL